MMKHTLESYEQSALDSLETAHKSDIGSDSERYYTARAGVYATLAVAAAVDGGATIADQAVATLQARDGD